MDYCEKGFGPAAGAIRRYFRELEEVTDRCAAVDPTKNTTGPQSELRPEEEEGGRHAATYARLARTYTPTAIGKLRQILGDARAAAGDDARVKARIDFLEVALRYGELQAAAHDMMQAKPLDKSRLLPLLDERNAAFRDIVRVHPFAVNVAFIAWREGSMWTKTGWKPKVAQ
jgi:hypothetical protein